MSYGQSISESIALTTTHTPIPREVVEHALSLRQSHALEISGDEASKRLGIENLSPQDQYLFRTRVFGGIAVKTALASFHADIPSFYSLDEDAQKQELAILTNEYVAQATDNSPSQLLQTYNGTEIFPHIPNNLVRSWVYSARQAETSVAQRLKTLAAYINVTPGSFPPAPYHVRPMGENDVTLVQAFGRDSITDKELAGVSSVQEKVSDDTVVMEYLDGISFKPGPSNIDLADIVAGQLTSENPVEQILQWEVTYALYQKYPELYKKYRNYLHSVWPHGEFYPTYEVKQDSIAIMDQIGLINPSELAHGDMMARAVGILEKLGVQPDPIAADISYDPESTQPHVRTANAFLGREVLARVEHILRGRVRF